MMNSPVGTAAWIIEAFHAWSDRRKRTFEEPFTLDQLLTEVMHYLVTDALPTSTWIYGVKREEETTLPPRPKTERANRTCRVSRPCVPDASPVGLRNCPTTSCSIAR